MCGFNPLVTLAATACLLTLASAQSLSVFSSCVNPLAAFTTSAPNYATIIGQSLITRGRPASIVVVANKEDVAKVVSCARKSNFKVCARSGGHALDGRSLCTGAIMIDLNKIRQISVVNGIATIGSGATLGEAYWQLHAKGRWFAGGTCPNVGVGGYLLAGGLGPYNGKLGLGCDTLEGVTMVTRDGHIIEASKTLRATLFWSMCGAGGSQFGIVTHFRLKTAPSTFFDNAVVFRFSWPKNKAGEVLSKYAAFDPPSGSTWVSTVVGFGGNTIIVQGACFNVFSVNECMNRLKSWPFFNVAGRKQNSMAKAKNALFVAGFFGPNGGWGNRFPENIWRAFNGKRFTDGGNGNNGSQLSAYLDFKGALPSASFWQKYINFCTAPGLASVRSMFCQVNLSKGAIRAPVYNAFPFRAATILFHVDINQMSDADRKTVYGWFRSHFSKYTIGAYANYQDLALGPNYAQMYWGKSLPKLKRIKSVYDPSNFFANPQPIPVQ